MQQQTIETLRQALQESALPFAQQEPLASHTTFQIGGPAVFWCTPKTVDQLRRTLALCRENGVRTYLLGNGSNTLFADEGYDGAVIDLHGLNFGPTAEPQPDGSTCLTAGAGLTLGRLCAVAQQQSLAGLAFACGIPGTIGRGRVYECRCLWRRDEGRAGKRDLFGQRPYRAHAACRRIGPGLPHQPV